MVIRHRRITPFIVLSGLIAASTSAHADTRDDIEERIRELNNELSQLHQQLQQVDELEADGETVVPPPSWSRLKISTSVASWNRNPDATPSRSLLTGPITCSR